MVSTAARQLLLLATALWLPVGVIAQPFDEDALDYAAEEAWLYQEACPSYGSYAVSSHPPLSKGRLKLPFQRPHAKCRTFSSPAVEKVIEEVTGRMPDADLARLFENAFPNTLDTTISWHDDGRDPRTVEPSHLQEKLGFEPYNPQRSVWTGPQTFVVTGDITAEWLRDSTNQLQNYQALAAKDPKVRTLILGAIATQAEFVIASPYCNAFQPPPPANLPTEGNGQTDEVRPAYEQSVVFECKYELDSLAAFLRLGNELRAATGSVDFVNERWTEAVYTVLEVLRAQSHPTFNATTGHYRHNAYTFRRQTTTGTETLSLNGIGNPIGYDTGLVRSAFRPSDDATILPLLVPANAMMATELRRAAEAVTKAGGRRLKELAAELGEWAGRIEAGLKEHAIVATRRWGEVYAYEVDGFGGQVLMDDANLPSLLALPLLGAVDRDDPVYQNTRRMVLAAEGNPYYLRGPAFNGIGGPHVGLHHAWPMSVLVQAMTSDNDTEIRWCLDAVKNASALGLIHESVNVNVIADYTRPWFAWANSVFAQTILHLADKKPHLVFGKDAKPWRIKDMKSLA